MAGSKKTTRTAAKNLIKGFVAGSTGLGVTAGTGNPVAGVAAGAAAGAFLDVMAAQIKQDPSASKRLIAIRANQAVTDADGIRRILNDVLGVAADEKARTALEQLAEAVEDPDRASENQVLIGALQKRIKKWDAGADLAEEVPGHGHRIEALENQREAISTGGQHDQIDIIRDKLNGGKVEVAIDRLEEMLSREGASLQAREKHRIHTLLGHAYLKATRKKEAIKSFMRAVDYEQESAGGQSILAYATFLDGKHDKAFQIADELIQNPDFGVMACAVWIMCAPSDQDIRELEKKIPERLRAEADVAHALATYALEHRQFKDAERNARQAIENTKDIGEYYYTLAIAMLEDERCSCVVCPPDQVVFENRNRVEEAEDHFSTALTLVTESRLKGLVHFNRSRCRTMLGRQEDANKDVEAARIHNADNSNIRFQSALVRMEQKSWDTALVELESIPEEERQSVFTLVHASVLSRCGDALQAIELLKHFVCDQDNLDVGIKVDALDLLFRESHRHEKLGNLIVFCTTLPEAQLPESVVSAFHAIVLFYDGQKNHAMDIAKKAFDELSKESDIDTTMFVAKATDIVGLHGESFSLLKDKLPPTILTHQTQRLLDCATQSDEPEFVLEYSQKLRDNGILDAACLNTEVNTCIQFHHTEKAIEILRSVLACDPPDDIRSIANLRISLIGIAQDRPNLVETDESDLPEVTCGSAIWGEATSVVIRQTQGANAAAEYAYQLIRHHPESIHAHRALVSAYFNPGSDQREYIKPDSIGVGCGFLYEESPGGSKNWLIIEEGTNPPPNHDRREISPDAARQRNLMGLKVGEEIEWGANPIQRNSIRILEIMPKSVRRFQDSLAHWKDIFPEDDSIHSVSMPQHDDGQIDVAPVLDHLVDRSHRINEMVETSSRLGLSATHIAKYGEKSLLQTFEYLSSRPDIGIRVCLGTGDEAEQGKKSYRSVDSIVLDESAVWTLYLVDSLNVLDGLEKNLFVTEGTFDQITAEYYVQKMNSSSAGTLFSSEGQLRLQETAPPLVEAEALRIKNFRDNLKKMVSVCDGMALARLSKDQRHNFLEYLPSSHYAESLAVAIEKEAALWTDDIAIAVLSQHLSNTPRVWTQCVIESMEHDGGLTQFDANETHCRLLSHGFVFTRLSPEKFAHALNSSGWDPLVTPLRQCIDFFSIPTLEKYAMADLIGPFVAKIWEGPTARLSLDITTQLLNQVKKHPDAAFILSGLYHYYTRHHFRSLQATAYRKSGALLAINLWMKENWDDIDPKGRKKRRSKGAQKFGHLK